LSREIGGGIMTTMNKIPKMLRELIEQKGKTSVKRVAKAIGVDHGSLYRALKEGGNPEGKTIEKILDFLGYEIRFTKSKERR
jgi:DNA-binding phage protein